MQKLIFVIGAPATGKTYFIKQNYNNKEVDILNIYDYQQRAYEEVKVGGAIPLGAEFRCLYKANDMLLKDIIERLALGRDVVVEQTFYKAKRRIAYIDEIKKFSDVMIEFYVMSPGDLRWNLNLKQRDLEERFDSFKELLDQIEFPNVAEGIDKIYEVVDDEIKLRMELPKSEILEIARAELAEEAKRIQEEDEEKKKHEDLLESMKVRPFWHYCEVCGKKEFITAEVALNDGWDYPPSIGFFGLLGPRTCGNCSLEDTLYWKVNTNGSLPIVLEGNLSPKELETWRRMKAEPESLLAEEKNILSD